MKQKNQRIVPLKRMRKLFIVLSLLACSSSYAQVSVKDIVFDKVTIDFGTIPAEGGVLEAHYTLVNKSSATFKIADIDVACGCTKPKASKLEVAPGDSAVITAEFNPFGMIGTVNKWIHVEGNFTDGLYKELRFTAEITSERLSLENTGDKYYPGQFGYLVIGEQFVNFGKQVQGFSGFDTIQMFNDGYQDIIIKEASQLPSYINVVNLPLKIAPKEEGFLILKMDLSEMDTVGEIEGEFGLETNDRFYPHKTIVYSVELEIDFDSWKRRQLKNAPAFEVDQKLVHMGNMKSGQVKESEIVIRNTGKTPLRIYRVDTDCSCAMLNDILGVIEPGDSIVAKVKFDALYKRGTQTKAVTIYTNDPLNPKVILGIRAVVL